MTNSSLEGAKTARSQLLWRKLALLGVLSLAIWLPRGLALDRFVTVDEPSWLTLSANFYHALTQGDFGHTFQIGHPGVTTMWAGTAAFVWRYPDYTAEAPGQVKWVEQDVGSIMRRQGHDPVDVLAGGRAIIVLAITGVLVIAFLMAVRLVGSGTALLGFLLIAADPFHIALSRVLHVDGLVSSLLLLSLLAFLSYVHTGRRRRDLVLSAVAAGLAWLTKAPSVFLIPFLGAVILFELLPKWRRTRRVRGDDVRRAAWPFVIWGTLGVLVFVLVWPAMWVDPISSIRAIAGEAIGMARLGHVEAQLFFNGAIVQGDPGFHFYPITYLWRTTPTVLAGLGLAAVTFAVPRLRPIDPTVLRTAAVLVLFVVLFTIIMSFGAKKFDRYLLPVYAPLDLLAAMGWMASARRLKEASHPLARRGAPVIVGLAVMGQAAVALPAFPYYFSYYNPVLGGTDKAPQVMMIGWGEGLDQVARYLNAKPNPERLRVTTWFWDGPFSYFFKGQSLPGPLTSGAALNPQWLSSDYLATYINQRQRGRLPRELLDHLERVKPAAIVRIQGLDYARIYDLRDDTLTARLPAERVGSNQR